MSRIKIARILARNAINVISAVHINRFVKDISPSYMDRLEWAKFVIRSGDDADYPDALEILEKSANNGNPEA